MRVIIRMEKKLFSSKYIVKVVIQENKHVDLFRVEVSS